jgi:hypothetical protein
MLDANPFAAVQQAGGPGIEQALPLAMDQLTSPCSMRSRVAMSRASCSLDWLLLDR